MRTIQDDNLETWEVYASVGRFGFPDQSNMVFQNLSDRSRRARVAVRPGDKAAVEQEIERLSTAELVELLATTEELK